MSDLEKYKSHESSSRVGKLNCRYKEKRSQAIKMLGLRGRYICRYLHTTNIVKGSQIKEKLKSFEKTQVLMHKTAKEIANANTKRKVQLKKMKKKGYSTQQALHLLKTKHNISEDDLKFGKLGPTSESDAKFLTMIKDRRMLYTILGINGEQLRDSKLVADDVKKFLKRGQVEKAVFLARLAKKKGSAGMNAVMEYYFLELGYPQSAVQMYNWRKKWGVPANEYTHTILFNGLAQQKQHISKANGEMVMRIVDGLINQEELTQIEFNAALGALSNCTEVTHAFDLYERKINGVRRDSITFLYMIRACCRVKSNQHFMDLINRVMEKLPPSYVDSQLLFEYCKAVSSRVEAKELKKATLMLLCTYFDLNIPESQLPSAPESLNILPLSHWFITEKFKTGQNAIGLFLENCLECEEYELGISLFHKLRDSNPDILDLGMYYNYMDLLIKSYPTSCVERCLKAFRDVEANGKLVSTRHSVILVHRAFIKQASKKYVNTDANRIEMMLNSYQAFIKEQEGIYSEEFGERIQGFQPWKSFVKVCKDLNSQNKISSEKLKVIIDDFSKSFCHGAFGLALKKRKDLENTKYIELETVRLLKSFAGRLEIPNVETQDTTSPGPHRETFLLRRLVLRMKDKVLVHVNLIEKDRPAEKEVEDLEWSIKQLARKIIDSKLFLPTSTEQK